MIEWLRFLQKPIDQYRIDLMKISVSCPRCGITCIKVMDKTMSINKDMLFQCPYCKCVIPVRILKTKYSNVWWLKNDNLKKE